jgi:ankyrin repeat protein
MGLGSCTGVSVDQANGNGCTAIYLAAYKGDEALVRLLLERGADASKCTKRSVATCPGP